MKDSIFSFFKLPLFRFFCCLTIFREFEGGGPKLFSLNVLIHGLELLGQEDISVPLPHAFQPL